MRIGRWSEPIVVFESMLLEIYGNENKYKKYIVGNVYRRPSGLSADLSQFIDEFTEVLNKVHSSSRQAYINGDFNIDLLTLNHDNYANAFHENMTSEGFSLKLQDQLVHVTILIH